MKKEVLIKGEKSMDKVTKEMTRLPYVKPMMEKVELVAEEAVLSTCKYNNGNLSQCAAEDLDCVVTQRS